MAPIPRKPALCVFEVRFMEDSLEGTAASDRERLDEALSGAHSPQTSATLGVRRSNLLIFNEFSINFHNFDDSFWYLVFLPNTS